MPIPYDNIHTNYLQTGQSTTITEILLRVMAIPHKDRRDLFLLVDLEPDGFAVVGMSDLDQALKTKGAAIMDGPLKDILELPQARSKTVERRKQGYRVARDLRDQSYKRRLVVLESGDPVGLLISATLAPGDFSHLFEQAIPASRERFVSVDFSSVNDPLPPLDHALPLQAAHTYYFYLEIGDTPGGLDEKPEPLPSDLPAEAELEVVVFGYPEGLHVQEGAGRGRIRLDPAGPGVVTKPAALPDISDHTPVLQNRLYFPLQTPSEPGEYQLRCLIYYQQALVQARIISAFVGTEPRRGPALYSAIDYTLSHTLDPAQLSHMADTRLSLFSNDNKDGTHSIAVKGRGLPESPPLHLGELIVKGWANNIRGDMREAAWGDRENFTRDKMNSYRYPVNALGDLDRLQEDLIRLAISGYRIYTDIALKLGTAVQEKLVLLLLQTSEIQFSAVENVTSVVPVAAIYDQPLDSSYTHDLTKYGLCDTFRTAFEQKLPLAETGCFQGRCPSYHDDRVVCPSGFWGYRHNLGLPVSVGQAPLDAAAVIPSTSPAEISVALSNAEDLRMRDRHKNVLSSIQANWDYHDSHEEVIKMLQETEAQIVYFYCHGGFDEKSSAPFLAFEQDPNGPRFYPDILQTKNINWSAATPLVFINGCYTTALDPEKTMNFVDRFVQFSRAAGVIGTEITIFESTAMIFAKQFFERFLIKRQPVGQAVRGARLALLEAGSPFGLVYIPFALPALKLEKPPA